MLFSALLALFILLLLFVSILIIILPPVPIIPEFLYQIRHRYDTTQADTTLIMVSLLEQSGLCHQIFIMYVEHGQHHSVLGVGRLQLLHLSGDGEHHHHHGYHHTISRTKVRPSIYV